MRELDQIRKKKKTKQITKPTYKKNKKKQMNNIKGNHQKCQKKYISYVIKQNNKRRKIKTEIHKLIHNLFFVVSSLSSILTTLKVVFLDFQVKLCLLIPSINLKY